MRAAIDYDERGTVQIGTAYRWRDRGISARLRLTTRMTVRQHAHLAACARPGCVGASKVLRRMLWALHAAIDPPVGA